MQKHPDTQVNEEITASDFGFSENLDDDPFSEIMGGHSRQGVRQHLQSESIKRLI